jgi:hypothetical protein
MQYAIYKQYTWPITTGHMDTILKHKNMWVKLQIITGVISQL